MFKGVVVHYVDKNTTQSEIKAIRKQYSDLQQRVIIFVSGNDNIMDNLKYFIKARAT